MRLGNEPFDEYEDRDEEWAEMVERVRDMRDLGLNPIQDIVDATGVAERTVQYWLNGRKVARNNMVREQLRRLAIKVDR